MLNFITRNFTSLMSFVTAPFRAIWRGIVRTFPEREFTIMDITRGNVYSYNQSSFWRFTKFCGKITLIIWATWSTYIYVYQRPLIQQRKGQIDDMRAQHARQMTDLTTYLGKYNSLTRGLNVNDDKILNYKKMTQAEKDNWIKNRASIWGELDFLQSKITNMFSDENYTPEFKKMSELSVEYDLMRAENTVLKEKNKKTAQMMASVYDADSQIVEITTKLSGAKTEELHKNLKRIESSLGQLGLNEKTLVEKANNFSNSVVGAVFRPIQIDKDLDSKYQKLGDNLELWSGLSRLNKILPLGSPVSKTQITSNYGLRDDPITGKPKQHKGIDFAGSVGTELFAIASGTVVSAGERVGYGKTVEIEHGLGFSTLYAHLSKINVSRGDSVHPGTLVGLGGSSGRSTGPHLHYEIRYKGAQFNPVNFVKEK